MVVLALSLLALGVVPTAIVAVVVATGVMSTIAVEAATLLEDESDVATWPLQLDTSSSVSPAMVLRIIPPSSGHRVAAHPDRWGRRA